MLFDSAIDPAFSTDLFVKGLDWGAPQMEQLGANRTVGGPLPVSCGGKFSTPEGALEVPDASISWATNHILSCEHPVV